MTSSLIKAAREAMATRFEVALHGDDPVRLRAAANEALDEISRLESLLNLHQPTSEIAHCNQRAANEPVPVSPEVFALLQHCCKLTTDTDGAFDITIAPLMRCWSFINGTGTVPTEDEIETAKAATGMQHVELDETTSTVRFRRENVMLDLGSIGKGHALQTAAELLLENGFENFLIHGGTSTVTARGDQPDGTPWRVAIEHPDEGEPPIRIVDLQDTSLSVSGIGGKSFIDTDGREQGHVIDPRTGRPTQAARVAAVLCPSATASDAFATALLTTGPTLFSSLPPNFRALTASMEEGQITLQTHNLD